MASPTVDPAPVPAKRTPGPWEIDYDCPATVNGVDAFAVLGPFGSAATPTFPNDRLVIADVALEADAGLIAEAPNLLAAAELSNAKRGFCIGACARYERDWDNDEDGYVRMISVDRGASYCDCGNEAIRAAIAATKGEAS